MFADIIGHSSVKVKNVVERGAVKKFAQSIGDEHPLFLDEEYGKKSRYQANIAPPTFPRTFDFGVIEALKLPSKGLIHGEQTYSYVRPLLVGEEVNCYSEVKNYVEKEGKSGTMGILTVASFGEDQQGQRIFSSEQVLILNEAVRRAMTV